MWDKFASATIYSTSNFVQAFARKKLNIFINSLGLSTTIWDNNLVSPWTVLNVN